MSLTGTSSVPYHLLNTVPLLVDYHRGGTLVLATISLTVLPKPMQEPSARLGPASKRGSVYVICGLRSALRASPQPRSYRADQSLFLYYDIVRNVLGYAHIYPDANLTYSDLLCPSWSHYTSIAWYDLTWTLFDHY
jgi:hypothetical protein